MISDIEKLISDSLKKNKPFDQLHVIAGFYEQNGEYLSTLLGLHSGSEFAEKIKDTMRLVLSDLFGLNDLNVKVSYIEEFALSAIISTLSHWYTQNKSISADDLVVLIQSMLKVGVYPQIERLRK